MARTATLIKPRNATISIETELHKIAVKRAKDTGLRGGFSEYVSRLIAADRARKNSAALRATKKRGSA